MLDKRPTSTARIVQILPIAAATVGGFVGGLVLGSFGSSNFADNFGGSGSMDVRSDALNVAQLVIEPVSVELVNAVPDAAAAVPVPNVALVQGDRFSGGPLECHMDLSKAKKIKNRLLKAEWVWPQDIEESKVKLQQSWFNTQEGAAITIVDRALASANAASTHHFLDIGANQGFYSLIAGHRGYRAIGIEVQRTCAEHFSCNAVWNGYTGHELWNRYAAEQVDEVTGRVIQIDGGLCSGHTSVVQEGLGHTPKTEFVPIRPLDVGRMVLERGLKIAAVKIDTEGYEANIFRSLRPLLAQRAIPNILVEMGPNSWETFGVPREEAMALFRQMYEEWGMTAYRVHGLPLKPAPKLPLDLSSWVTHLPTFEDLETELEDLWVADFWFTLDGEAVIQATY
ncbi:hypothetical protein M427DRAFT_73140 [Gonapodya prolifera JEL478]|uniref:Methyltransferase FkbM domain-containing protein n=1 Tax=Gonapodya prolifera (strain JEL478) TaxID=1344416 RepID=A0A139A335_GONPJ|nr:hypothetical protein M427DRAFT_73140 [Gonapodya prolifera JEL478]|eukprot:KXS11170.1 hypothetical protein M427DRAFT_73140 [Gonapodya prolifera JEL478]